MGLNNLDVLMGVENRVVYDIVDVIENRCRVRQALVEDPETNGLFILPSVHSYDCSRVDSQSIKAVIASLKSRFDYVLIDCPAGIELGFHRSVAAADEAIVVTTPHLSALRDAGKVIKLLKSYELKKDYRGAQPGARRHGIFRRKRNRKRREGNAWRAASGRGAGGR